MTKRGRDDDSCGCSSIFLHVLQVLGFSKKNDDDDDCKPNTDDDGRRSSTIVSSVAKTVIPCVHTWKIQRFSSIARTLPQFHYSGIFDAGGYQWQLVMHPEEVRKDGKRCLSLYLRLAHGYALPKWSVLELICELFVRNQTGGEHKKVKGQLVYKSSSWSWGSLMVPSETFTDPCSGFLVDDTCFLGVEILVIRARTERIECLTLEENIRPHGLTWKMSNFYNKSFHKSDSFTSGGFTWHLKTFPESVHKAFKGICVFLNLENAAETLKPSTALHVEYAMILINQIHAKHETITGILQFSQLSESWGLANFLESVAYDDPSSGFLVDNTCIMEIKVTVLGIVKH